MACRRKINTFALLLFVIWQPSSKCRLPVFCSTARDTRRRKFYEITRVFAQALRRKNLREFSGTFQILEFSKREVGYFLTADEDCCYSLPLLVPTGPLAQTEGLHPLVLSLCLLAPGLLALHPVQFDILRHQTPICDKILKRMK